MKVLYLDESGDHNLSVVDPQYPLFVLGGVIMDETYAADTLTLALDRLKQELFSNQEIILHTSDIVRNRNGFEALTDAHRRLLFYERVNALVEGLEFKVVACVIRKNDHLARYGRNAFDPYQLSLRVLVERFCFELGTARTSGRIIAEQRGPELDRQIELAWQDILNRGTEYANADAIRRCVAEFQLRGKQENLAGLQLADLVVSPIGRHVLGKPDREDWRIVERKLRRDRNGSYAGHGLVMLPK